MNSTLRARVFRSIGLLLTMFCLNGCLTTYVSEKAQPFTYQNSEGKEVKAAVNPGYYALVPLTLPIDIATYPLLYLSGIVNWIMTGHLH